ncbi:hypothetical protein ACHQM5_014855 [Ranunculus cassubicifolius]
MANFLERILLPLLLLTAALLNWSLISLIDLLFFLLIHYTTSKGFSARRHAYVAWFIFIFSVLSVLSEAIFHVIWVIEGEEWSIPDAWWAKLIGFVRARSMRSSPALFFPLTLQLLVAFITIISIYGYRLHLKSWNSSSIEQLGSHLRVLCCLLLPVVQLVAGISHPSFISLPFFICSCVGLVGWSLTSNISGLFRWWRPLLMYASFNIVALYTYQLPVQFPYMIQLTAEIIGLYKVSAVMEWPQICCSLSLLLFYFMLSTVRYDLEEMDFILSMKKGNLAEQLLPLKHSFLVRESRSGIKHTNVLLRGAVFRTFSINFFTYGFPVSLFALSYWSWCFTSIFALALLAYVGYILYAFPSLFHLHRLNGSLLVFILFWCFGTYIFNVMFMILNKQTEKDIEIWETIGFWHYPIPGLYLFAQFCLGILVAVGNLVNDSVFIYQSNQDGPSHDGEYIAKDEEGTKVLIIAIIAWGLRKSSRAITLTLIFLISMKPGLIHALYMVFFLVFLLSHTLSGKILKSLILLCEVHFALLHILELDIVSNALERKDSFTNEVLAQLGFQDHASSLDFLQIAALLCFSAVYNHGFKVLSSFSAIVQHTPYPPIGFSILRAGLDKSVLLSVYTPSKLEKKRLIHSPHERRIATYISVIGDTFLSAYRLCGTYVAFLTILITVYLMKPNYISFGYLFFLLLWIGGRQFIDRTRRRLWFPLKVYAILVFSFTYCLSNFTSFRTWLSGMINLYLNLGYDLEASFLQNVGESLAVMIVMQLYSCERRKSKYNTSKDLDPSKPTVLGFTRRILIWHSEKLLSVAVFYASLSPVSAFGFVYLLGLVICSTLPKTSRVPSKVFLFYTGLLVTGEYLYQMWGEHFAMFPGQRHASLSLVLGLQVYSPGFWGLEFGLRGKVLVIFACTLQYHTFHWLEKMPNAIVNRGKWEESCPLFVSAGDVLHSDSIFTEESKPSETSSSLKQRDGTSNLRPSFDSVFSQGSGSASGSESAGHDGNPVNDICGSPKENHKWNKKRILSLRKERFDMQKTALKVCLKFWMENMFRIFGLEINMIALLLASFVLLNVISLLYIAFLASCILLGRRLLRKLWFIFVISFASILFLEYFSLWRHQTPLNQHLPSDTKLRCHDCWGNSFFHFKYCKNCWLGFIIDDPQMLVSYYIVFMLACFKLRADHLDSFSESHTYRQMMSQRRNAFWTDLSFETKCMWTMFDYLRLYCYCHLLDIVIILILITGTLEYDILHIGYLGCALVFFRIRLQILKKRNKIFKFLRMYNFALIVLSLAYQSPFLGNSNGGKCGKYDYIYEMIGFYKYDYGFRITSRSAFVEIIIYMLVSLQSYMFSSQDFDYVSRYLEAEQIGAIAREQEKKASWKTAQLLHIRKSEDLKHQRNLQVEKIKSEMLNLQVQLESMKSIVNDNRSQGEESLRRRRRASVDVDNGTDSPDKAYIIPEKIETDLFSSFEMHSSPISKNSNPSSVESPRYTFNPLHEITEVLHKSPEGEIIDSDRNEEVRKQKTKLPLVSAVQLIRDGVSQVQTIGNQVIANLVSFLNLSHEDLHSYEQSSSKIGMHNDRDGQKRSSEHADRMSSVHSSNGMATSESASMQIWRIFSYMIQSNNDVVCYCCFVLIFLWNFSLLSMVYLAALFLYALCVYTGPSYMFWVIMLIYTEVYILLQYLYQIIIHHYVLDIHWELLHELGFPNQKITSSFVISSWPLFLVYLFTLLQNSITAADGEWDSLTQFKVFKGKHRYLEAIVGISSWKERICKKLSQTTDFMKVVLRSFNWYWKSLTQGAESPPHFLQLSMEVKMWPEDGIQPERIESGINRLLNIGCDKIDKEMSSSLGHSAYRVRVQSIKRSQENPNLVLVVFEVVCAFPLPESPRTEWFKSLTPAADAAKEILEAQSAGVDGEIGFPYPIISVIGGGRREIDLYAYVFGADLTVFFLVAIFYHSIMKNSDQLLEVYQFDDQFPKEFVFILMILFFLIVLDRIIYLCSLATGKVLLYLFNLVLFTYSVTKYAWYMEPSQKQAGAVAIRVIYLAKAASLALQAIQIRYGIPHKSTLYRQFLTSKVSRINFLGFRLYRVLPFLYELRCLLDWSCTVTSLTMYDWLKLEDIYSSLYLVKCDADLNRANHQHGQKQTNTTKCCNGICLFFILICVIWAPMLMYSSGNPTNIANPIKDANVQIDIKTAGGRLTLYQTTLCQIISLIDLRINGANLDPQGYLDAYKIYDTQLICCQSDASVLWTVPPSIQSRFAKSIDADTHIVFSWVLTRDRPKDKQVVKYEIVANPPNPSEVQAVLNGSTNAFTIYEFYPRYFRVTGSGDIRLLEQTVENVSCDLVMSRGTKEWWSFHDTNVSDVGGCAGPMAIVVSEETPQGILGETLSKFSIWGLYISFVLAVGRFIRLQCSDLRMRVPFENLPSCDRLMAICEDIYAARAEGELEIEEVLYWTLIKIYRSPHMLLEYTKSD